MKSGQEPPPAPAPAPARITDSFTMTSARRPSDPDGENIQETTMAGAGAAGGTADRPNLITDDNEEQAAAHRNRSKEEDEDARKKKEEAEAALAVFLGIRCIGNSHVFCNTYIRTMILYCRVY